ncbi:MAG: TrkH family potassium uptake protein, partial [Pirellulaceae bacterium]
VFRQLKSNPVWADFLLLPGEDTATADRASNFRIRWARMTVWDALFESQSGFSTTGASVMSELEDPQAIASCIHFWRSSTHFLGGLGIIVLFVVLLGQGSAGKALMRTEVPGPASDGTSARVQHSAWTFAAIYVVLNVVLTVILLLLGMGLFDALCHAFGTMATGGFSTYNSSLGHFQSPAIEYVIIVFMILAGTNFTLLYLVVLKQPGRLFADLEWRTYIMLIVVVTTVIIIFGWTHRDPGFEQAEPAFRNGLFQVVSIMTTTGYGTQDFDAWNQFARLVFLMLMFVGGCAGSTGGGMKVIRHVLISKVLWIEIEKAFHPRVVKPLRYQGRGETDENELKHGLLVYVTLVLALFLAGWLFVVGCEPATTWGPDESNKLVDSASAVAATLNNIGPGLGVVGPTHNYGNFSGMSKILFVWLMMLGRLEIWPIIVLFAPRFWRNR